MRRSQATEVAASVLTLLLLLASVALLDIQLPPTVRTPMMVGTAEVVFVFLIILGVYFGAWRQFRAYQGRSTLDRAACLRIGMCSSFAYLVYSVLLQSLHILLWRALGRAHIDSIEVFPRTCVLALEHWVRIFRSMSPVSGDCWEPACGAGLMKHGGLLVHEQGSHNVTELLELPGACRSIIDTDVVTPDTMTECGSFCSTLLGEATAWLPIPFMCSAYEYNSTTHLFKACAKAATARIAWVVRPQWAPVALGLLYFVIGLIILCFERLIAGQSDYASLRLEPAEESASEESSEEEVLSSGSATTTTGPSEIVLPSEDESRLGPLNVPLCVLPCRTDAERAQLQLRMTTISVVLDPMTDIMAIASFAANGQPWWMLFTTLAVAAGGDVWQVGGLRAIHASWRQGFPTTDLFERHVHEGLIEGTISGAIALHSVLCVSPSALGWVTFATRILSAGVSLGLAMPGALQAKALLDAQFLSDLDLNDYYAQEDAKAKFSAIDKYGLSLSTVFLTAAAALTKENSSIVELCFGFIVLQAAGAHFLPPRMMRVGLVAAGLIVMLFWSRFEAVLPAMDRQADRLDV